MSEAKRARTDRLVQLHRSSYISNNALTSVLRDIRDNGLPSAISQSAQLRAHVRHCKTDTPYGSVYNEIELPLSKGPMKVGVQMPAAMLYALVRSSLPLRLLIKEKLARHPCSLMSKWRLAVYVDGISPENPLSKRRDKRMVEAWYWSFLEFDEHLSCEDIWFCFSAVRTFKRNELPGGASQLMGILLEKLFFDKQNGTDLSTQGIILDLSDAGDGTCMMTLHAEHAMTIADEKALAELYMNKGHAGTKPCPLCRNIVHHKSQYLEHDATGILLPSTNLACDQWKKNTDEHIRRQLKQQSCQKQKYKHCKKGTTHRNQKQKCCRHLFLLKTMF